MLGDTINTIFPILILEYNVAVLRTLEDVHITEIPCQETIFECELSRPVSSNAVQWTVTPLYQTTAQIITPSDHYKLEIDKEGMLCRLRVVDLRKDDAGTYSFSTYKASTSASLTIDCMANMFCSCALLKSMLCFIAFICKKQTSSFYFSIHLVPPAFKFSKEFSTSLRMRAGESRILEVPFEANPRPTVEWTWTAKATKPTRSTMVTESSKARIRCESVPGLTCLTLTKVDRSDAGAYKLVVENKLGNIELVIDLTVFGMQIAFLG